MLHKFLQFMRASAAASGGGFDDEPFHRPYGSAAVNQFYNGLFCDDLRPFGPKADEVPAHWQSVLFGRASTAQAVRALAMDHQAPGHVRALACHWLRARGHAVPRQLLHGVVIELELSAGLDVLAVFSDGTIRHINHAGEPVACDAAAIHLQFAALRLLAQAQSVLRRLAPCTKPRAAAPARGSVRLSFLASDGLYCDEGPMSLMRHEPRAGRLIRQADELRQLALEQTPGRRPVRLNDVVTARAA